MCLQECLLLYISTLFLLQFPALQKKINKILKNLQKKIAIISILPYICIRKMLDNYCGYSGKDYMTDPGFLFRGKVTVSCQTHIVTATVFNKIYKKMK